MKIKALTAILATMSLSISGMVLSQSLGDSVNTSVAEVIASETKDDYVALQGQIIRQVGGERYILTDDTGVIQIKIDEQYTRLLPLNPPVQLEVFGQVAKNDNTLEIDVRYYSIF